jgi:hypothetical protein
MFQTNPGVLAGGSTMPVSRGVAPVWVARRRRKELQS